MQKPLARLLSGWVLMLAGGILLIECGISASRGSRLFPAVAALGGSILFATGLWLRRIAVKQTP
jgi:hypothetical protein